MDETVRDGSETRRDGRRRTAFEQAAPGRPSDGLPAAALQETAETADFRVDYEHSGDRRVDDALDRLARLPGTPLPGHADVYDAVHTELRAILSEQPAGAQGPR